LDAIWQAHFCGQWPIVLDGNVSFICDEFLRLQSNVMNGEGISEPVTE